MTSNKTVIIIPTQKASGALDFHNTFLHHSLCQLLEYWSLVPVFKGALQKDCRPQRGLTKASGDPPPLKKWRDFEIRRASCGDAGALR